MAQSSVLCCAVPSVCHAGAVHSASTTTSVSFVDGYISPSLRLLHY